MYRTFAGGIYDCPDVSAYNFYDVLDVKEISIHGLYNTRALRKYCRMPEDVASRTSKSVESLNYNTSGGRIRFSTNSPSIAVRFIESNVILYQNMSVSASAGIDVYISKNRIRQSYLATLKPQLDPHADCVHILNLGEGTKELTLYLPIYNPLDKLEIGICDGYSIYEPAPYADMPPIVYYGSSITQGGSVSRPGLTYQAKICRESGIDYTCLGFSGSAKGEDAMIEYLASLDMSAFVSDYDHNANDDELLNTHEKLYKKVRANHPDIPYIIIGKPDVSINYHHRRSIVFGTYDRARKNGDNNVFYIDSYMLFGGHGREDCTVDGCHPNDLGMHRMSDAIGSVVLKALKVI